MRASVGERNRLLCVLGVDGQIKGKHIILFYFFFSSRRRHTRLQGDWSSDVCSSDLQTRAAPLGIEVLLANSLEEWNQLMEGDYFAVLAQYPATSGRIDDLRADVDKADRKSVV